MVRSLFFWTFYNIGLGLIPNVLALTFYILFISIRPPYYLAYGSFRWVDSGHCCIGHHQYIDVAVALKYIRTHTLSVQSASGRAFHSFLFFFSSSSSFPHFFKWKTEPGNARLMGQLQHQLRPIDSCNKLWIRRHNNNTTITTPATQ